MKNGSAALFAVIMSVCFVVGGVSGAVVSSVLIEGPQTIDIPEGTLIVPENGNPYYYFENGIVITNQVFKVTSDTQDNVIIVWPDGPSGDNFIVTITQSDNNEKIAYENITVTLVRDGEEENVVIGLIEPGLGDEILVYLNRECGAEELLILDQYVELREYGNIHGTRNWWARFLYEILRRVFPWLPPLPEPPNNGLVFGYLDADLEKVSSLPFVEEVIGTMGLPRAFQVVADYVIATEGSYSYENGLVATQFFVVQVENAENSSPWP